MKKCKGCGAVLQDQDIKKVGFVSDLNMDYCQRCFRLSHYGDLNSFDLGLPLNREIEEIYRQEQDALFVVILDGIDALVIGQDDLLSYYQDHPVLLVINKFDLFPRNVSEKKLISHFLEQLKMNGHDNIVSLLLSRKNDPSFPSLFLDTVKELPYRRLVFAGRANAGKSTLINMLISSSTLTVSRYPGTTVGTNEMVWNDYVLIDTPGLMDEESFLSLIPVSQIKRVYPDKTIRPQVFQLYEPQCYFIEGLACISISASKKASVVFYINRDLQIHRTSLKNRDHYLSNLSSYTDLTLLPFVSHNFLCKNKQFFLIKGLGYLEINGQAEGEIMIKEGVKIYENKGNYLC